MWDTIANQFNSFFFHFHLCVVASFAMTSHFNWKLETVFWVRRIELVDLHKKMSLSLSFYIHIYSFIYLFVYSHQRFSFSLPLLASLYFSITTTDKTERRHEKKNHFENQLVHFDGNFSCLPLSSSSLLLYYCSHLIAHSYTIIYAFMHIYFFSFVRSFVLSSIC